MKINFYKLLLSVISLFIINTANAAQLAAVNPDSCKQLKNTTQPFILVIKRGDNLVEAIIDCANAANLASASLSGLGALEQPRLGYFNLNTKKYQYKTFPGVYELTSLTGNIGFKDGEHFAHIHITLGDDQYNIIGGHLDDAKVGATAEITFIPLAASFERKYDKNAGLQLISTSK